MNRRVKCVLNGLDFDALKIGVSKYTGLFDELKPKPLKTHDWKNYHGLAMPSSFKRYYEPREITLDCWVEGASWREMRANFETVVKEFRKSGNQRLLIDIFGEGILVYNVICEDKVELQKTFADGEMVGFFTLRLKELNPIKKLLKVPAEKVVQLKFTSDTWIEINYGGNVELLRGAIHINRVFGGVVYNGFIYTTIAGDIDGLKEFYTDAEVLWEKF